MSNDQPVVVPEGADHVIRQGRALSRAIEALEAIEPSGGFERAGARLLVKAYKRRLREIIGNAPTWVGNRIFDATASIRDRGAVLFGNN
jgi:hypothetical protein